MRKEHAVEEEISLLRFKYHVLDFYGVVLKIEMDFDRPFLGGIWYQSGQKGCDAFKIETRKAC